MLFQNKKIILLAISCFILSSCGASRYDKTIVKTVYGPQNFGCHKVSIKYNTIKKEGKARIIKCGLNPEKKGSLTVSLVKSDLQYTVSQVVMLTPLRDKGLDCSISGTQNVSNNAVRDYGSRDSIISQDSDTVGDISSTTSSVITGASIVQRKAFYKIKCK